MAINSTMSTLENVPFFSIIIPTFNRASEITRTIQSVLDQSFLDFELLIVDDGSTDNTKNVVGGFNDVRIKYKWNEHSGCPATPRNAGINLAIGEWICFLDSDDTWKVDKLLVCFNSINDNVDLIYHDVKINNKSGVFSRKKSRGRILTTPVLVDLLVNSNTIVNSSVVIRKEIFDRIGPINNSSDVIATEDYNTWLKVAEVSDNFLYIPEILGEYSISFDSISNRDMSLPVMAATREFTYCLNNGQRKKYLSWIKYMKGRYKYVNGDYLTAKNNLMVSLRDGVNEIKLKSLSMLLIIILFK